MSEINGYTRTCGLLGNPVAHTLSPVIHNNLAEKTGDNLVYVPFHVPTGHVEEAVKGALALNILGLNVTVPYKSDVIPYLMDIDPLAERIGAVNTLVRCEGGYKGYNTDMPGLYRAMCSDGVSIEDEEVIILGAGGVARAVAMMLLEMGAKKTIIFNRSLDKAEKIADEVNKYAQRDFAIAFPFPAYKELNDYKKYIVIQATNVGMYPNTEQCVVEDNDFYKKVKVGYDLIFNPGCTTFMKNVMAGGGEAYNGLKMLLYQGIIAYELWTGKKISDEWADEVYLKMQEKL